MQRLAQRISQKLALPSQLHRAEGLAERVRQQELQRHLEEAPSLLRKAERRGYWDQGCELVEARRWRAGAGQVVVEG